MSEAFKSVMLFGAPGVGKGTQGKILGAIPGFYHTACGDLFRSIDRESELGRVFAQYSSRGELVPDDVTVRMWRSAIGDRVRDGFYTPDRDLLILDGIPRTVEQAGIMDGLIEVLKGLEPGEPVVVAGHQRLRDGAPITVATGTGAPPATAG